MNKPLCIAGLQQAYGSGTLTPAALVAQIHEAIARTRDYNIWISLVGEEQLQAWLARLQGSDPARLPLYGIPFAIKDNIDLAGVPTTAACPALSHTPDRSAPVVEQLIRAGALPIGKTNMDQLATGLVGTRSPYGATHNARVPGYISGGSSSGSAVAVALGQCSFALGTDTAGSGRIPAAFNQLVGYKPTRGVVGMSGVVPACRTLDCLSVFANTAADVRQVAALMVAEDPDDAFARRADFDRPGFLARLQQGSVLPATFAVGVPRRPQLQYFGHGDYERRFRRCLQGLRERGAELHEVDFTPFLQAAELLYDGPWVAERFLVAQRLLGSDAQALRPELQRILAGAGAHSAADAFAACYRLQELKLEADRAMYGLECMLTPTAGGCFSLAEVEADPIGLNTRLGYYTNFMNLLDYTAVAIPGDEPGAGLPFGITLFAAAGRDAGLLQRAAWFMEVS